MKRIVRKTWFKYLASFLLLFLILMAMTVKPLMTITLGEEILIKTRPFDPRDIFRGDYVILRYEIDYINLDQLDKEIRNLIGEGYDEYEKLRKKQLYVSLKKDGDIYKVDRVTLKRPSKGIYLQGKYEYTDIDYSEVKETKSKPKVKGIMVRYTLDKYFVPENTGTQLEEKARKGEVFAKVKVYKGFAILRDIL